MSRIVLRRRISSFLETGPKTEPIILGAGIGSKERRAAAVFGLDRDCG